MFPTVSDAPVASRKRSLSDPGRTSGSSAKKAAPEATPPQTDISRLQDLSSELHSACLAYMPPADIVQYAGALPPPMSGLAEAAAAALSLDIEAAHTFTELRALAERLCSIDPAFRHRPIQQMQAVLRQLARRMPLHGLASVQGLLQPCRQACADLPDWRSTRLQQACHEVELLIGMRQSQSATQLLALTRQVPGVHAAAQGSVLVHGLRAVDRLLRAPVVAGRPIGDLEPVLLNALQLARGLSAPDNATVLRGAFEVLAEAGRHLDQMPWPEAQQSLPAEVARLPPAQIHRAVPTDDDQFVETVVDLMGSMPQASGLALYDALLEGLPQAGRSRLDGLTNMAALLMELPDCAIPARMEKISRETEGLDRRLAHRGNILLELASDAVFRALPPADVLPAFDLLLEATEHCELDPLACEKLYDELEDRIGLAPPETQAGLRSRLQQAQAAHPNPNPDSDPEH